MKTRTLFILLVVILLCNYHSYGQSITGIDSIDHILRAHIKETPFYKEQQIETDEESALKIIDNLPAFGIFRDTYFTTGIPLNQSINENTADALFQISVRHRITRSRLPFNTFLFITYTQKSFWDIYAKSSPFRDNNYNPAIGLGKYIIHDNKFKGTAFLQIEHESNGKDSIDSRSWNMISLSIKYFFNLQLSVGCKIWIPFVDGEHNEDLLDYRGCGVFSLNYIAKDFRWWFSADINPRKGFGNANTTFTAGYKVSEKSNQYAFVRFYNGVGDSLLDYKKYNMNIRVGFCIKPDFGSVF